MTSTDDLTWQVWQLHYQQLSVRQIAKRLGVSRSRVHRILQAGPPVVDDGDDDPWTDDELPLTLDTDVTDVMLAAPFTFAGLVEVIDPMPTRKQRQDGSRVRHAPQWRDANGYEFGEVELCLWRAHRESEILPGDFPNRETYLAAWDAMTADVVAATEHAWDSVHAAGVVYDDDRRRWAQRPRAV